MLSSYQALIKQCPSDLTLFSNTSAFIMEVMSDLNWAGFYFLNQQNQLILGPFQGKVACEVIELNQGVCGHCATTQQPVIVADVHQFQGHIACDSASNSELVVPLFYETQLIGVIDLDSPQFNRFSSEDCQFITELSQYLSKALKKGNPLLP